MNILGSLADGAGRFRRALLGSESRFVEVGGIRSTAALVRAIDAIMPRNAILWIDYPADEAVELFLVERAGGTGSRRASYRLPIVGDNLERLARLVEGTRPGGLGIHLGVEQAREQLLLAYDLDDPEPEVSLSVMLDREAMARFRAIATAGPRP